MRQLGEDVRNVLAFVPFCATEIVFFLIIFAK
ncbi:hypothetical protein EZS27_006637 [termite gut metagenome]|jgi:hypothetical protein|uniref:Uncharacterized protein n=1 Tax=termite gut metagenome TaxID=433724 RepID=A0A5J4SHZ0_9ZZZZ